MSGSDVSREYGDGADEGRPDVPAGRSPGVEGGDDVAHGAGGELALTFPDLPRLELDQLLGQLVDRAHEVMATQGRLRGLLQANQLVIGDLALPVVLRRIVEAARALVGARYAALGVIAPTGGLAEFVHMGMPADAVEQIGHLPQGKGLLAALIDDPRPIRLNRISDDQRSSGFPPGHPPMSSFLGVPIRVRDEVFGNLYLTESTKGEFSSEDEELLGALAATAAVAIENSRLYEAARLRGRWLQASAAITRELLFAEGGAAGPLSLIAERCREIAEAELVMVLVPDDGERDELRVEVAVGTVAEEVTGRRVPVAESPAGRVFSTGEPLRVAHSQELAGLLSVISALFDTGPVLIVPLLGSQRVLGVLHLVRLNGRPAFTAEEVEMVTGFANQAAVAFELAEARAEQQRVALYDERDRIAADLHDQVIQRLFVAGLALQSVVASLPSGRSSERVLATIEDLDQTIAQIRSTIFRLHRVQRPSGHGVRDRLLDVLGEVAPSLGFEPALRLSGVLEDSRIAEVADDLVAVLREALTNVARHARARSADVEVMSSAGRLTIVVRDDGVGVGSTTPLSGLANLRRRADQYGGQLALSPNSPAGTELSWSIPIH